MAGVGDLYEEIVLPERPGLLGSKSYRNCNGKIVKTTRLVFCDNCGFKLDENMSVVLCHVCGKKLCSSHSCAFEYERRHYCEQHVQQVLPLSVHGFMILHCILKEVEVRKVRRLGGIADDAYRHALDELLLVGYAKKTGISLLTAYEILDRGVQAWRTYFKAYAMQGDVARFFMELNQVSRK